MHDSQGWACMCVPLRLVDHDYAVRLHKLNWLRRLQPVRRVQVSAWTAMVIRPWNTTLAVNGNACTCTLAVNCNACTCTQFALGAQVYISSCMPEDE